MPTVRTESRDGIATITLDRPGALNALSLALARELGEAVTAAERDDAVRCVVLAAAGTAFCAGGDLKEFAANADRIVAHTRELSTLLHGAQTRLMLMAKPVIVAVNGVAAGGGYGLALSGDIVIAAESARFTPAYARIGAAPDGGFTYFVPRLVGLRRAQELYFLDRSLTAAEALEWGLLTRVVPDAELATTVRDLAATLASGPTRAFALTKRLLHASLGGALEAQLELESRAISESSSTEDWAGATKAFLEKRAPEFRGR